MVFRDREDAGRQLGRAVAGLDPVEPVVLGLPRGGVPVADQVAAALDAPLGIVAVRKLGVPGHSELAFGAIAEHGAKVLNHNVVTMFGLRAEAMNSVEDQERAEMERRLQAYVGDAPRPILEGKMAIVVDDGLATGATMRAAVEAVKTQRPAHVVVAVPVASPRTVELLAQSVDRVIAVKTPVDFMAVGEFYADFRPTRDEEVQAILAAHHQ